MNTAKIHGCEVTQPQPSALSAIISRIENSLVECHGSVNNIEGRASQLMRFQKEVENSSCKGEPQDATVHDRLIEVADKIERLLDRLHDVSNHLNAVV